MNPALLHLLTLLQLLLKKSLKVHLYFTSVRYHKVKSCLRRTGCYFLEGYFLVLFDVSSRVNEV